MRAASRSPAAAKLPPITRTSPSGPGPSGSHHKQARTLPFVPGRVVSAQPVAQGVWESKLAPMVAASGANTVRRRLMEWRTWTHGMRSIVQPIANLTRPAGPVPAASPRVRIPVHPRPPPRAKMPPMSPVQPVVELAQVAKAVREGGAVRQILDGVDLQIADGEAVAILGRSGSGKSTLLNLIAGLDRADRGRVVTAGLDLTGADERARAALRARHLGFVFQAFHLLPTLTVAENVALPLELAGMPRQAANQRVAEMLARVGLADRATAWPAVLSGGEQQRVAVARALAPRPSLLLCDEPTGNLDDAAASLVLDLLTELQRATRCALVLVTHSRTAAAICDRQLHLEGGRLRTHQPEPQP